MVRSGRGMLLTPRALALKPQVHAVILEAGKTLEPEKPFVARELSRTFVVHATDYVLTILGTTVDRMFREEAPNAGLRFVPNSPDDAAFLRDHGSDLAIGIYGDLPNEMRCQQLLTDRFVCAARKSHPALKKRFALEDFVRLPHIQVAPRGKPGGYIDDVLQQRGLSRRVARAVPYFVTALHMVAETDYLLTISERIAKRFSASLSLKLLEIPLPLRPYALSLLWHPRMDGDAGHRFLRDVFLRASKKVAGNRHTEARLRLDAKHPTPDPDSPRSAKSQNRVRAEDRK